jgi:ankyrin repeat protein
MTFDYLQKVREFVTSSNIQNDSIICFRSTLSIFLIFATSMSLSSLLKALRIGDLERIKEQFKNEVNINAQNKRDNYLLIETLVPEHLETVKFLLDADADPKKAGLLTHASWKNNREII